MIYKIGYIAFFILFFPFGAYAVESSTDVIPPTVKAVQQPGYILGQGSRQTYCNPDDSKNNWSNCNRFIVSNTQCPPGYKPRISIGVTNNNYGFACKFQRFVIDGPNDGQNFTPTDNGMGGYYWQTWKAYTEFESCPSRNITIDWIAVCIK